MTRYPRTYHLPWSPGATNDDKILKSVDQFIGVPLALTEKLDGCLMRDAHITLADHSKVMIASIVKSEKEFFVLGQDKEGNLVPSKVLNKFKNGKNNKWIKIYFTRSNMEGNSYGSLTLTPNHEVFNINEDNYKRADNLKIKDKILIKTSNVQSLNYNQIQVLLGTMLGDGSMSKNPTASSARISYGHTKLKIDYVHWKDKILGNLYSKSEEFNSGYGTLMYSSRTKNSFSIWEEFKDFQINTKKSVPITIANKIGPLALAVWYCDDGSLSHQLNQQDRANLATNGFDLDSINNLRKTLKDKFGIISEIQEDKREGHGHSIRINKDSADILFSIISPYIPECMQYKLPEYYRTNTNWCPIIEYGGRDELIEQEIIKIEEIEINRQKFDLETETHNYFANGVLVHNSQVSINTDFFHARSINGEPNHPSFDWLKSEYHGNFKWHMPENYTVCCEYLYAKHSIHYSNLESYLFVIGVRDELNQLWLSWDDVTEFAEELKIPTVPVLEYYKTFNSVAELEKVTTKLATQHGAYGLQEGVVVRHAHAFKVEDFATKVGKWVRANHVETDEHWANQAIIKNLLSLPDSP